MNDVALWAGVSASYEGAIGSHAFQERERSFKAALVTNIFRRAYHTGNLQARTWYCIQTDGWHRDNCLARALGCKQDDLCRRWPVMHRLLKKAFPTEGFQLRQYSRGSAWDPLEGVHKEKNLQWIWLSEHFFYHDFGAYTVPLDLPRNVTPIPQPLRFKPSEPVGREYKTPKDKLEAQGSPHVRKKSAAQQQQGRAGAAGGDTRVKGVGRGGVIATPHELTWQARAHAIMADDPEPVTTGAAASSASGAAGGGAGGGRRRRRASMQMATPHNMGAALQNEGGGAAATAGSDDSDAASDDEEDDADYGSHDSLHGTSSDDSSGDDLGDRTRGRPGRVAKVRGRRASSRRAVGEEDGDDDDYADMLPP